MPPSESRSASQIVPLAPAPSWTLRRYWPATVARREGAERAALARLADRRRALERLDARELGRGLRAAPELAADSETREPADECARRRGQHQRQDLAVDCRRDPESARGAAGRTDGDRRRQRGLGPGDFEFLRIRIGCRFGLQRDPSRTETEQQRKRGKFCASRQRTQAVPLMQWVAGEADRTAPSTGARGDRSPALGAHALPAELIESLESGHDVGRAAEHVRPHSQIVGVHHGAQRFSDRGAPEPRREAHQRGMPELVWDEARLVAEVLAIEAQAQEESVGGGRAVLSLNIQV
jgi:hypothetical protein